MSGRPDEPADEFRVVTWNVLGHIHTHWCHAAHLNAFATTNSTRNPTTPPLESASQRRRRHEREIRVLRELRPDALLLQEVDDHFLPSESAWRAGATLPLPGYTLYRSSGRRAEGTAVLLRDAAFAVAAPGVARLPATAAHGWKTGIVVHARRVGAGPGAPLHAFASVHLRHGNAAAQRALLRSAVRAVAPGAAVALGGDFNLERARISDVVGALAAGGLRRVAIDAGPTSLGGCAAAPPAFRPAPDGDERLIDHLWISARLSPSAVASDARAWAVGALPLLPQHPRGPWGDGPSDGSDHAWVRLDLSCSTS